LHYNLFISLLNSVRIKIDYLKKYIINSYLLSKM